ncbi:hypothetical protein [Agrococcus sp. HG114]|uniref:hypothetical protein n=1 Tax=Agrococcus sp. HG114 TaxID=2969757 RepID=UPI00215AEE9E|nr:hypothetical protein [Agrococcus sp. HG114]MCR8669811.1 hypothetical protein [Agrococcus sp. HG114]
MLRGPSYAKPFVGVRSVAQPETRLERAAAFAPLLRPWQCFGGATALAILGLPVPWRLDGHGDLEVLAPKGRSKPERPGVRVRRLAEPHLDMWEVEGMRVASAPLAWALMGARCTPHELVVLGDAVVSGAENYPDRRLPGPLASIAELHEVVARWGRRAGAEALRQALPRIRRRVESPRETDMRLLIVDAGMPEPEVQAKVYDPTTGRLLGRADLMHRHAGVVEEYEGKGHRDEGQWDRDIQKYRDFERIGLHVVRATNRDFVPTPDRWLAELAAVLRRRTP